MKFIFTFLFILLLSFSNFGQDYAKDFRKLYELFESLDGYSFKTKVNLFDESNSNVSAFVKSTKDGVHYKIGETELMINNKYTISIDHEYKEIRVYKDIDYKLNKKKIDDQIGLDQLEQMIRDSTNVKYLGKTSSYKTYEIQGASVVEKVIVKISLVTGFLSSIEYIYKEKTDGMTGYKVTYINFIKNPIVSKKYFSEDNFFIKKNKKIELTKKYKNYTLTFIE